MHRVSLSDKFDLSQQTVFLSGTQALVRLVLAQRARDAAAGHHTAAYITGYRGSPLGGLDLQFGRARRVLGPDVLFQPGLNEDLAATACWGTQTPHLTGENRYDGVFSLWYGKGPGVDRSGDALRHANLAGTSPLGGVLALMGDDHTCESSTTAHQSEFAMVNTMIPVLSPAGVQDIVDFGLLGIAMSRYSGAWIGLKLVKDTVESTASIDGRVDRLAIRLPDGPAPDVAIRTGFSALEQEARLMEVKLPAAERFAHLNGLNRIVHSGGRAARVGIAGTGKSWLDVLEALDQLGLDEVALADLGVRLFKVAMPWPLPREDVHAFADGLDEIIVVEEKRGLIEPQIKELLYGTANAPRVIGKTDETGAPLFRAAGALGANHVALEIGRRLAARGAERVKGPLAAVEALEAELARTTSIAERKPYFCAGCPHSTSTTVPPGMRAAAGIGCHFMVLAMDRDHVGFTHMGGEGAQWLGEGPFSTRRHIIQNLGDGTYNHSGSLAIRAAHAAGVNITFKVLYNDAVALTGGQALDGGLTVHQIAAQVAAEGATAVAIVSDEPEKYGHLPGVTVDHRDDLTAVQRRLGETDGVTVLIYDQTCAAEKRRRRKRGTFPDPDRRVVINERVCEGCGDCGVQSNCVAIQPVETVNGRKRKIDQSVCNKDFSCLKGFCPSFVTVHGGVLKKAARPEVPEGLPEPQRAPLDGPMGILVTGVGGTGVVTVGAVIGMAAHIEGLGAGIIDMAGLAQKGGAVLSHIKIARTREEVTTIRVGPGGASAVLACDIVVAGGARVLWALTTSTTVIANTHEQLPGDFTRDVDFSLPTRRIIDSLKKRANTTAFDANRAARALFGDTIAANTIILGAAFQSGALPLSADSIEAAIRLNGAAVEMNLAAFRFGRLSIADPARFAAAVDAAGAPLPADHTPPATGAERIARHAASLGAYQDEAYAARYTARLERLVAATADMDAEHLIETAAFELYRLMAIKDEYEVARLFSDGAFAEQIAGEFESYERLTFHLAPPLLTQPDPATGRPKKHAFGGWMRHLFPLLARARRLRGTPFDIFGRTAERRAERALLAKYEDTLDHIAKTLTPARLDEATRLAAWPAPVRGYGPVRAAAMARALPEAERLRAQYDAVPADPEAVAAA
ncbi:MAG: indolepyruvate ferredoxin oxidoreductase family protein [Acuticoccus sp.]